MHIGGTSDAERPISVLIVDSDPEFRKDSCEVIARRGHAAWGARDLIAAVSFLQDQTPDFMFVELALLDMDGADPLGDLRASAPEAPVVIMSEGAPDERFRGFARAHDVFGYLDRGHGEDGLIMWLDSGVRLLRGLGAVRSMRRQIRQVLESVPELHRVQSLEDVMEAILLRAYEIFGGQGSFVAARISDPVGNPPIEGSPPAPNSLSDYVVGAGSIDYPAGARLQDLESLPLDAVRRAIEECRGIIDEKFGVLPLALGGQILGLAYLDRPGHNGQDPELLQLFASQAAAALRNAALYELATVDSTSRVFRKTYAVERLKETLKLAWRKGFPVSVMIVDIDGFKQLNDEHGRPVGDRALRHVGRMLRKSVRDSDIVGRFGGDSFFVVLVDADRTGAGIVRRRLMEQMEDPRFAPPKGVPELAISVGAASLESEIDRKPEEYGLPDFGSVVDRLLELADRARRGADVDGGALALSWATFARDKAS